MQFRMKIDAGHGDLRSVVGAICSCMVFLLVLIFALYKFDVFYSKKDVDILSTINDNYFTPDHVISYKNGFNIAAAFTAFDSGMEEILDPTVGELVFMHY